MGHIKNFISSLKDRKLFCGISIYTFCISFTVFIFIALTIFIFYPNKASDKASEAISKSYEEEGSRAEDYYYRGQYHKALEEYKKLEEKDSLNGLWEAELAKIYSIKGDAENSKNHLEKAKREENVSADILNNIVFTNFMNKEYDAALETGKAALNKFPKHKGLVKTMFAVFMANNKMEDAENILNIYPVDIKSAYDLAEYAQMLMTAEKWEEGYKALKKAFNIDKDEYKIYDVLAQISMHNREALIQSISSLSQKDPKDLAYKMWIAKIYSIGEATSKEAEKLIDEIKSIEAGGIELELLEAYVLQNLKQNDKADEIIKRLIEENKEDYGVLHAAGWYYLNKGDYAAALNYCNKSILKNKAYTDNYAYLMPEIFRKTEETEEAEPYFRTALYMEPYNHNIMLSAADYYLNSAKDSERALQYFKLAEIIKPLEPKIKYSIAEINISNKNIEEAVKLLKQAIDLDESNGKYHRTLGTVYLLSGKPEEAIKEIRQAFNCDKKDILALNNAGCYYITETVNFTKAEYNLRKAVEGITSATDRYVSDSIKENYKKVKEFMDSYNKGNGNTLKMPDFVLFY